MQYQVTSPKEYLEVIDSDWRKDKLLEIRTLILETDPEITESIGYKMLCYSWKGQPVFYLNAQKDYVGFYIGTIDQVAHWEQSLQGFNRGKGCIRVKKSNQVTKENLGDFIANTIQVWKDGGNTNC